MSQLNTTITTSEPSDYFRICLILLFLLIVLIGLIGNSLVLLSISIDPMKLRRSSTHFLLGNMSCADLIILLFNIFDLVQFAYDPHWPTAWYFGLILCKIVRFAQVFACYVSVQTLLVISIERYISIIHPRKFSSIHRRTRLYFTFIFIWLVGFIFASPNLYLLKLHPFYHRPKYFICGLSDHQTDLKFLRIYKYTESIFFFFLPALIQTILYMIICQKIFIIDRAIQYSSMKLPCSSSLTSSSKPIVISNNYARKKAILMLLIIAIVYFLSFSPTQINFLYTQIQHSHHLYEHRLFLVITILLALSSTAINPILFVIFSQFFRMEFYKFIRMIFPRRRRRRFAEENIQMN